MNRRLEELVKIAFSIVQSPQILMGLFLRQRGIGLACPFCMSLVTSFQNSAHMRQKCRKKGTAKSVDNPNTFGKSPAVDGFPVKHHCSIWTQRFRPSNCCMATSTCNLFSTSPAKMVELFVDFSMEIALGSVHFTRM